MQIRAPHEHERRRLRDHAGRLAGADRRPRLRLGREPRHPRVPRGLRGGADGRTTFEPALDNDRWPWPTLNVFVLASRRPAGTPDRVVTRATRRGCWSRSGRPTRAATSTSSAARARIETFRALGALDKLELVAAALLLGDGMRLTPSISADAGLTFERSRNLPGGSVEIVYGMTARATVPGRDAGWSPASHGRRGFGAAPSSSRRSR